LHLKPTLPVSRPFCYVQFPGAGPLPYNATRIAEVLNGSRQLADLLEAWVPDAAMRKRVLVDNPARLYGFA